MSDKPETEVYGIPGDLAEIGVPVWTPVAVRRYANELAARLDDPKIEDKYRLARHRKIERARRLGDRDPYRAAELLRQVEALCDAPDVERGRKTRKAAAKGGDVRAGAMRGRLDREARQAAAAVAEVEAHGLNRTAAVAHVAKNIDKYVTNRRTMSVRTVWNMLKRGG